MNILRAKFLTLKNIQHLYVYGNIYPRNFHCKIFVQYIEVAKPQNNCHAKQSTAMVVTV